MALLDRVTTALADLTSDVLITSAASGDALKYNGSKWVNTTSLTLTGGLTTGTTTAVTGNLATFVQPTTGNGTVSNSAGGTTVTGVGTAFTRDFVIGQTITVNGETRTISAMASATSMTTDAWTGANSGAAYTLTGGTRAELLGNGRINFFGASVSGSSHRLANWETSYTNPETVIIIYSDLTITRTANSSRQTVGNNSFIRVGGSNTGDWTGNRGIVGYSQSAVINSGATGTITGVVGYLTFYSNSGSGTVTKVQHFIADTTTSTAVNLVGFNAGLQSGGSTGNCHFLGGTVTPPSGNWGVHEASSYSNYFASSIVVGTTTVPASSLLTLESTTKGFLPPRMTTTERNAISSPATGLTIYNTSTNKLNLYTGSGWEAVTSA